MTTVLAKVIETWKEAKADCCGEKGQLTFGGTGAYDGMHTEHGWWLTPRSWGLGVAVDKLDWLPGGYDGRICVLIHLGPLSWDFSLCQPLRPAVKR